MKIIAIAHRSETHTAKQFAPLLDAEADYALQLLTEEFVREIYSRRDGKGAVLVLEAESEEEARARLAGLPLLQAGMLHIDLYPCAPYRGITRYAKG